MPDLVLSKLVVIWFGFDEARPSFGPRAANPVTLRSGSTCRPPPDRSTSTSPAFGPCSARAASGTLGDGGRAAPIPGAAELESRRHRARSVPRERQRPVPPKALPQWSALRDHQPLPVRPRPAQCLNGLPGSSRVELRNTPHPEHLGWGSRAARRGQEADNGTVSENYDSIRLRYVSRFASQALPFAEPSRVSGFGFRQPPQAARGAAFSAGRERVEPRPLGGGCSEQTGFPYCSRGRRVSRGNCRHDKQRQSQFSED